MIRRGKKRAALYARARLDRQLPPPKLGDPTPHPCIAAAMLKAWAADDPPSTALHELSEKYALAVWIALLEAGVV
jgi:hypothetical protein